VKETAMHFMKSGIPVMMLVVLAAGPAAAEQGAVPVDKSRIKGGEQFHESYMYQSAISNFSDKSLGAIAGENSPLNEGDLTYGFAAKSEEAKFFLVGSLYAESLAYLHSAAADEAAQRLRAIERQFITLNVPRSLYNYVSKMRNMVETKRYDTELAAELLSLFQPFFEDYAKEQSEDMLILFRAGLWLLDMTLTAEAGDLVLLRQTETLDYFTEQMRRMDAPRGVLSALEDISGIVSQESVSDRDVRQILKQVKRIQTILG
jgi:hypothetical protein